MFSRRSVIKVTALAGILVLLAVLPALGADMPKSFRMATNAQGSLFYAAGAAISKVLSQHMPVKTRVQPYAGTSMSLPLINSGEVELGLNNTNDVRMAYRGLKPFLPTPKLRMINVMFALRVAAMVRAKSPYRKVSDLKGTRVAGDFSAQLAVWYNATSILGGDGLGYDDVRKVTTANVVTGTQLLIEDKVDATFFAIGAGKTREANATIPGGIRWLSINSTPSGVAKMQELMPGTYAIPVKKGAAPGVLEDIIVQAYDCFITTSTNLSDAAAMALVKAIYNAEAEVKKSFPAYRPFSKNKMVKTNVTIPYHSGAVKAYKELGLWSNELDRVQAKLLSEAAK